MRHATIGGYRYAFDTLPTLLAHATPARSGNGLAGIAAPSEEARVAASFAPVSKTTSAASCSACRWAAPSATPTMPRPIRTTWTPYLTLLATAGVNFVMGVPSADDVMLGYQSTSFHDALATRELLGKRPAPEFETWFQTQGLLDAAPRSRPPYPVAPGTNARRTGFSGVALKDDSAGIALESQ